MKIKSFQKQCAVCKKEFFVIFGNRKQKTCGPHCGGILSGGSSPIPLEKRFWPKVNIAGSNECWEWQAGKTRFGYGSFKTFAGNEAHRYSYVLHNGPIPDGKVVCHKCDNPSCVNPAHLFLGSQSDNMQDMFSKNRHNPAKGESTGSHKLTENDVLLIRQYRREKTYQVQELAEMYGVSTYTVWQVVTYRKWKHVA